MFLLTDESENESENRIILYFSVFLFLDHSGRCNPSPIVTEHDGDISISQKYGIEFSVF